MSEVCKRSGQKLYAADNPIRIGGLVYSPRHFTCKATGTKITLKTCVICTDPETGEKDVYLRGKEPIFKPTQVPDMIDARVGKVPDASHRNSDKSFNFADGQGSAYGAGAVAVETAKGAPDAAMRTTDRKFNIAGKGATRGTDSEHAGSSYGADSVTIAGQMTSPKAPTSVNNINMMEKRHNGTDEYTGVKDEAGAE